MCIRDRFLPALLLWLKRYFRILFAICLGTGYITCSCLRLADSDFFGIERRPEAFVCLITSLLVAVSLIVHIHFAFWKWLGLSKIFFLELHVRRFLDVHFFYYRYLWLIFAWTVNGCSGSFWMLWILRLSWQTILRENARFYLRAKYLNLLWFFLS